MAEGLMSLFPTLQCSKTPVLQGRDFQKNLTAAILPFIDHYFWVSISTPVQSAGTPLTI